MIAFGERELLRAPQTVAERLAILPEAERARILGRMDDDELLELEYNWRGVWARPAQLPPDVPFTHWGIVAGRGSGKTRSAAEWIREEVESNQHQFVNLVGRSAGDVRDVMIEGESGLLAISHPDFMPRYEPSKKRLTWPNGTIGACFNSTEPEELRGPQCSLYWGDEVGAWKYATETWDNLMFGFRLGRRTRGVFTTTPRPIKLMRDLMLGQQPGVVLAPRMSTYDNIANLAENFISTVVAKYEGTRIGRQELLGELLLDVPGALWNLAMIEDQRVKQAPSLAELSRIVVAIDPAVTSGEGSNETGIIAVARDRRPTPHFYVLKDKSGRLPAIDWARQAVRLFHELKADRIVAEVNNGGDLVEAQIRVVDKNVPYQKVHASRGKYKRAEPVAALYEQKRVHHVGAFDALEDQMITFVPDDDREGEDSPDRVDALVWGLTALLNVIEPPPLPGTHSQRTFR